MIRPVRPDGTIETGGVFVPIIRRRVIERIASAAMQRVVLIVAPAGYGKSVALRQYIDTLSEPCLRYDVLPENGGLLGFLRGFADAVGDVAPDARGTLPGAYEKNAGSASPGHDLALWMHSHLKSFRGIIAIDDLQVAQDDREVTRFLTSLIERTKGRVQWIVASRATTGLPIGTWLAYGESDLAIDEHDLKFTVEDAKDAARAFRLGVRDEELFELLHLTDGWATAMTFALRSSTRSVDLRNISSMTREMVYRYLAEQVYQTLSEEERSFIENAALLPEINLDVMVAAGFDRASALLTDLRERVAFIQEDESGKFRLHDLFRDFVLHEFEKLGRERVLETNEKLAALLERLEMHVEALRLFVQAQAIDEVVRLLSLHGSRLINLGFADEVDFALNANFGASYVRMPLVLGLRGLIESARGNIAEAERLMLQAMRAEIDPAFARTMKLHLAQLRSNRDEDSRDLLLELVDDAELPLDVRLEAQAMLAIVYGKAGEAEKARALSTLLLDECVHQVSDQSRALVFLRVGNALFHAADYGRAKDCLSRAVEVAAAAGLWGVASKADRTLSMLTLVIDSDPSTSLIYAQKAVAAASRAGDMAEHVNSLVVILSLETRRGNAERAAAVERQIAELNAANAARLIFIISSQAHRKAWVGDFAEAARLFGSILDRQPHPADRLIVRMLHALSLSLAGFTKQSASALADAMVAFDAATKARPIQASPVVECALAFAVLSEISAGRLTSASRLLKRHAVDVSALPASMRTAAENLLLRAKSASFDEPLDDQLEAIRALGYGGYARHIEIVAAFVNQQRASEESVTLTPSELRILRHLSSGLSPKEIAADMDRSVYTVQTHIQNLSEKLGTHGRAGTLAAARRLGLLDGAGGHGPT